MTTPISPSFKILVGSYANKNSQKISEIGQTHELLWSCNPHRKFINKPPTLYFQTNPVQEINYNPFYDQIYKKYKDLHFFQPKICQIYELKSYRNYAIKQLNPSSNNFKTIKCKSGCAKNN